ncbi:MAG TPA: hypothetical protein VN811_02200 [Thermoanaerobaculia bacterium]|nr:hypothetical protein [Thermoanaerobaculia bacterium]HXT49822.1 hypothetical protein [Thermoanaerobaculia bacterium]
MLVARRLAFVVAALLLSAGSLPATVLTPGTLYALVYDLSVNEERVVTVDPSTGAFTPVGSSIPDCCLIGGFPVYALDANTGGFYAAGFLKSDPADSDFRMLGFDAVTGTLSTSPFLTSGMYLNNLFKLDIGTGILWGLVFDLGAAEEQVVIVTPSIADRTAIGNTIANCCTIGGFNVSAFNPANGRLYVAGNLLSDPGGSAKRLLGFDALTGTLVSSPSLSSAWQYNDFEMDPLTGTLYGIVFDAGTSKEFVVTVNPGTGAVTTVGSGIADCCTVSSFNAFDPYAGVLYIMGNRFSDPGGSSPRLLGFDVATGTLSTFPFLPTGWQFNVLQVVATPTANQPPVAMCQDVEVNAAPNQCGADASIDDGSYDPEGAPLLLSQDPGGPYPIGDTLVTLIAFDGELSASCQATVTVVGENTAPTELSCNSPATITPPQAPISFTASAVNSCGEAAPPTITGSECYKLTGNGARQHAAGCKVETSGATIEIKNTGGVGTHIEWMIASGAETLLCSVVVADPGQ